MPYENINSRPAIFGSANLKSRPTSIRLIFYTTLLAVTAFFSEQPEFLLLISPLLLSILISLSKVSPNKVGFVDIISLVYFLYFVIVPLQKLHNGGFADGEMRQLWAYPNETFLIVMCLATFSYITLVLAVTRIEKLAPPRVEIEKNRAGLYFFVSLISFACLVLAWGGFERLLLPRYELIELTIAEQGSVIFRAVLSVSIVLYFLAPTRGSITIWAGRVILLGLLVVAANPLSTARFVLLGMWGPLLFTQFRFLLYPTWFYSISLVGTLLVMPILNITTRFGLDPPRLITEFSTGIQFENMNVFELSSETLHYVERNGPELGEALSATLFFWVPRFMWGEKPVTSNLLVGRYTIDQGAGNENLAVAWFMDGYLDFLFIGSIIYSALAGIALYLLARKAHFLVNGAPVFLAIFISNFPILARGTLAVTFQLFLFQFVSIFLLLWMSKRSVRAVDDTSGPRFIALGDRNSGLERTRLGS